MAKRKIETPGAVEETLTSDVVTQHVETIEKCAEMIEKHGGRDAKREVRNMLSEARNAISAIREEEKARELMRKKPAIEMKNINIHKSEKSTISGKGIRLTNEGYIVD